MMRFNRSKSATVPKPRGDRRHAREPQRRGGGQQRDASSQPAAAAARVGLARLGLDYVDIFYHHRPDPDTPLEETIGTLNDIVRSGKALYAGISSYNGTMTDAAMKLARELRVRLEDIIAVLFEEEPFGEEEEARIGARRQHAHHHVPAPIQ